jgi:flagella basal body P-ring formation protein FlgA
MKVCASARTPWIAIAALALAALVASPAGLAQAVRPDSSERMAATGEARLDERLKLFVDRETAGLGGRVEVSVGELHPGVQLAACAKIELFVPHGSRLWGRTAIGARCTEGAAWQVFLPVTVRVFAPVLVGARSIAVGETVAEADVRVEEIDLTREPAGLLNDLAHVRDTVAARPIQPGLPLRADHLRRRPVVIAGDPVRLLYRGDQFQVMAEGKALGAAAEGQSVRVQTESGRVLTGIAQASRTVEIRY